MALHFESLVVAILLLLSPRRCMPSSIYATNYEDFKMQRHATCPCQPGFPTQLLGKRRRDRRGMNASLFVSMVKKTGCK
jgi:hypothetical protein